MSWSVKVAQILVYFYCILSLLTKTDFLSSIVAGQNRLPLDLLLDFFIAL